MLGISLIYSPLDIVINRNQNNRQKTSFLKEKTTTDFNMTDDYFI